MVQTEIVLAISIVSTLLALSYYFSHRSKQKDTTEVLIEEGKEILEVKAFNTPTDLTEVKGIGPKRSKKLRAIGIDTIRTLAECSPKDLATKIAISETIIARWVENANEILRRDHRG
jgi:predicted flap endonuclease-1-like 5' DNA nuclease